MNLYDSRILIVDDEKALSRMVEGVLQKEGFFRIYTAADCKSAELLTAENEFQMILLDVMLPDGDGFSLYKVMRETEKNRNTPVIFLSARDENGKCAMAKDGTDIVDLYQGFAMVIDNTGKIIWEYKLPEELEQTYTLQEVAVFAKWYLKDYPVDIHVVPNGILVLGRPKDTIWKYNISHSLGTMEALLKYIPYLLLIDILLLIVIPFIILRHQNRQKEKERTTWIAGVSHDIRTPLSLVLGYADEIGREGFDQETVQKAQVIEEQAIRIRSLITNLNTENKLAYGMGNWEKERILLPALIREISCDWLNRNIGEQYELNVDISQKLEQFYVTGNRELLRRMLDNLINNAIVHNPEGCKIMISLQEKKVGWQTKCELTVSDNGQGASKEQLRKLQAPLKLEKLSEHGLGLRLVKRIAKMQHWRVRFCNHAEGGFCCRIEM